MFTGIIELTGRLAQAPQPAGDGLRFTVEPATPLAALQIGESIAINGVCLTVEEGSSPNELRFFASDETLRRTTLGIAEPGMVLNLERSLLAGARLGGHLVMGHVDAVGEIRLWRDLGASLLLEVAFPPALARFIALKGSIAVDGISLTVSALTADTFQVAVIPHTAAATNLQHAQPGRGVNLEVDMLARYVVRALESQASNSIDPLNPTAASKQTPAAPRITADFLERAGF